jgi:hypothetical protein
MREADVSTKPNGPISADVERLRAAHPEGDTFERTWVRLRNARVVQGTSLVVTALVGPALPNWAGSGFFVAFAAVFLACGVTIFRARCPRCGKYFTHNWGWSNPWTSKCVNCRLRQWTPSWSAEPTLGNGGNNG